MGLSDGAKDLPELRMRASESRPAVRLGSLAEHYAAKVGFVDFLAKYLRKIHFPHIPAGHFGIVPNGALR
jgi:hypothetical protein